MMRFGIVGTNFISEWFAGACRATDRRAEPVAVCSRSLRRAEQFAEEIGAATAFDDVTAMAATVDAVYVASPISAHRAQALDVIAAGRHVLVEKTMGASAGEVESILGAAESAGVIAMEAVRNVHTPAHRLLREALPQVGTVRYARFEKLQYSSRYDRVRAGERLNAFDPALGNSALADIGVYCLQPALDLFGRPARTSGSSVWLPGGFKAGGSLQLDYGTHLIDVVYSKIVAGQGPSVIHGEDGSLVFDDPSETGRIRLLPRSGPPQTLLDVGAVRAADTLTPEILDFIEQVDAGRADPRWSRLTRDSRELTDEHLARPRGGRSVTS